MGGPTCHDVGKALLALTFDHGRNKSSIHIKMAHPTLTSINMVGHTIYHPRKGPTLTSIGMIGHTIYHPRKGSTLTSDLVIKA